MQNLEGNTSAAPFDSPEEKEFAGIQLFDLLSRIIPGIFFLTAVLHKIIDLAGLLRNSGVHQEYPTRLSLIATIGSRASVIIFLSLMVVLFVVRTQPINKAKGVLPRIMAIAGTFFMALVTMFPRVSLSPIQAVAATSLVLIGTCMSIYALGYLGRSFSLMAEARRLVTSGPYRFVRHPLYLAEMIASFGVFLQFLSVSTALVFVTLIWIQIQRMKNEESVLQETFPAYETYKASVSRLIPRIY